MHDQPLHKSHIENEWQTILQIAKNNQFPTSLIHKLKHHMTQKRTQNPTATRTSLTTKKNEIGTPSHSQTSGESPPYPNRQVLRLLSGAKTHSHTQSKTTHNTEPPPHDRPGIHQLKRNTCNRSYIGQTSRSIKTCYHEHIRYIKNNNPQSAYAQHILDNEHEYGTMNNLMTLLKALHS